MYSHYALNSRAPLAKLPLQERHRKTPKAHKNFDNHATHSLSAHKLFVNRCCALALLIGLNATTYIAIQFLADHI